MRYRWLFFGGLALAALLSFGAWRSFVQAAERQNRGYALPTQAQALPYRLPLAGVNVQLTQYENPTAELTRIAELNFYWVRQPFLWAEIEPRRGEFHWEPYDAIVEAVDDLGGRLQLVALLDGSPAWARHPDAPEHPYAPPASPSDFGSFAQALAERYGDTINVYQIWDEPNLAEHWGNLNPNPAQYLAMLDTAYSAIHSADGDASVIMAALAPNVEDGPDNINDPAYLHAIYALGGGNSFDAAAGKPYGYNLPPTDRSVDLSIANFSRLILLREEMVKQGDGDKPLWGSNFGWNTLPPDWQHQPSLWGSVTAEQQRDYTRQAYERAQREWAWAGGLILQHWQPDAPADNPIQGFALAPHADEWAGVIPPLPDAMPPGRFPAVNPYATYRGDWDFGELGADGQPGNPPNTITIPFRGTDFALEVRRGDYLAYLLVEIDGKPANLLPRHNNGDAFIALTSEQRTESLDLIPVASGLDPTQPHTAVVTHRPEQGQDYWSIAGFAVSNVSRQADKRPAQIALGIFICSLAATLIVALRLPWQQLGLPSNAARRDVKDLLLGLFFSSFMMLGAILTMQETLSAALKRDLPALVTLLASASILYYAPSQWIALGGVLLTGLAIFNRPWLGVLLVLFWSAFFTTTLDPFFRALYIVDVMLIVTLAATFTRLAVDQAKRGQTLRLASLVHLRLHPLDWIVLALCGLGLLSLLWSDYTGLALREVRVLLIMPAIFYLLIRVLHPGERDLAFAVETLLFTGFLLAAIGLVNYFQDQVVTTEEGSKRLLSVYGSPNSVGLMLGRCLPFALAYLLVPVTRWRKILAAVSGITMLFAVVLSQSVGAILLGLPAAFVLILLGWRGRQSLPWLAGLAAAGVSALWVLAQFLPRLRQVSDLSNSTTLFRLNLWRSTAQTLQDHPLTGVGMDQFLYAYRSRYILPEAWRDPDLSHPHNVLLDYWVRLGIGGVFLGVALQLFFWRHALWVYEQVRHHSPLRFALVLGAMGAMADFLAHGIVDMAHFAINLSYVLALLLALVVALEQDLRAPEA